MKVIGITGGIGSGKSTVIDIMKEHYHAYLISTDEIAIRLMQKGNSSYKKVVEYFGLDILREDGEIDRAKLAQRVFQSEEELLKLNSFTHKEVRKVVLEEINKNRENYDYIIVETALPYEARLKEYCDEVWYVYASLEIRRNRLIENRGYSLEKVTDILNKQLSDGNFREYAHKILVNDTTMGDALVQIQKLLASS